jgi:hypothetical protein
MLNKLILSKVSSKITPINIEITTNLVFDSFSNSDTDSIPYENSKKEVVFLSFTKAVFSWYGNSSNTNE